jgi:N-acetyl-anhydromuramyl-L-alanine amidase AmpD
MPSQMVRLSVFTCGAVVLAWPSPALAGWQRDMARAVIPVLARKAKDSLIQREVYDIEEPAPKPAPDMANPTWSYGAQPRNHGAAANDLQNWDSDERPPARYYTNDRWKPRPAFDYLERDEPTPPSAKQSSTPMKYDQSVPSSTAYDTTTAGRSFQSGTAGALSYQQMIDSKVFVLCPMRGGTYSRQDKVKYIILHSTETGSPASAQRVIQSWSNRGSRHPGAQFVVNRDGTIYTTVNPDIATIHINTKKTRPGYSNDNSIGIEIVRSGKQKYTPSQFDSVTCLVAYLQMHYRIANENVTTHAYVQPGDRSDPVGFDMHNFLIAKSTLMNPTAIAMTASKSANSAKQTNKPSASLASAKSNTSIARNSMLQCAPAVRETVERMPPTAPDFRRI